MRWGEVKAQRAPHAATAAVDSARSCGRDSRADCGLRTSAASLRSTCSLVEHHPKEPNGVACERRVMCLHEQDCARVWEHCKALTVV